MVGDAVTQIHALILTGSRDAPEVLAENAVRALLATMEPKPQVYVGDARGLDAAAVRACKALGARGRIFKAHWGRHGKAAGPIRNRRMLQAAIDEHGAEYCHCAGFYYRRKSPGTSDMLDAASTAGVRHTVNWLCDCRCHLPPRDPCPVKRGACCGAGVPF